MEFKEEQKFTQWWLWLLLAAIGIFQLVILFNRLILEEKVSDSAMSTAGFIMTSTCIFLIIGLFYILRLKARIDRAGIKMQYVPFVRKNVSWHEIESVEVLDYGFVGGWGIRFWTSYGTVYNVKGSMGLAIKLTSGKKFLIGTQKPSELEAFLEKYKDQFQ